MESPSKGETKKSPKEQPARRVELPIKEVLSLGDLQKKFKDKPDVTEEVVKAYTGLNEEEQFNIIYEHVESEFYIFCACKSCLDYREVILQLINDHLKTRSIWRMLRKIITNFYRPIIEKAPSCVKETYETLVDDEKYCWLINGIVNRSKMQHLDFISDISLTDNVIFMLYSTLLMVDDAHQLLELMSHQVECFAKAYAEGLTQKILSSSKGQFPAEDLITYVLNGYEEMCKVAESMSRFLFAFESNHLEQFSLTWLLLNKRMYQRWVYSTFAATMPECIIKLKDEVLPERYAELVMNYIKFDDDMTAVNKKWKEVWVSLYKFHLSPKEQERRKRIKVVNNIFETIRGEVCVPFIQFVDIPDWETHDERQIVWQNMVAYVKKRWPSVDEVRINGFICDEPCRNCNAPLEFHKMPNLPKMSQEPEKLGLCFKCTFMDKIEKEGTNYVSKMLSKCVNDYKLLELKKQAVRNEPSTSFKKDSNDEEPKEVYHLSWAIFKHLKDRKPYPYKTIEQKYFCSNCRRTACLLAKKFLNKEIAFCLAQQLLNYYQPFSITLDEMFETVPCVALYNHKAISILYDSIYDDVVLRTLWTFITSAVASYFADAEADSNMPQVEHLRLVDNDIELPMEFLEGNLRSKRFIDFFGKTLGILQTDDKSFSFSQKTLKEAIAEEVKKKNTPTKNINPPKNDEIYEDPPVRWEPETPKPKEEENPKPKQGCSDQVTNTEPCKENHFSKMCFHEKECTHARINETRDRLRKKLSQLTNAKKNVKTINKNGAKSPLELIKSLNKSPPSLSSLSKEMAKMQNKANITKEATNNNKANIKSAPEKEEKSKPTVSKETKATNTTAPVETKTENLDEWVKDTLSFIEGCAEPKKTKNAVNNKKAVKKAKQKQKKEEMKRIEELQALRAQFHDLYFKEFLSKNELKTQKAAKKKDKKRIGDLENNIKKLSKAKSKIEANILELIASIKSMNSEFKFSYLPTKEQQQEVLKKLNSTETPSTNVSTNNCESPQVPPTVYYPTEPQFVPPNEFRAQPSNVQMTFPPHSPDDALDPSKRIVTIRRVNLPNVPEPQVTVTAKGPSPDEDKLLYTFINGQLVPATSLDVKALSALQPTIFPQLKQLQFVTHKEEQQKQRSNLNNNKNSALKEQPVAKTKTQLKKERKRAKILAMEAEKKLEENKVVKQTSNEMISKKHAKVSKENLFESAHDKIKKSNHKEASKNPSLDSGINSRENSVGNGKSKNQKNVKQVVSTKNPLSKGKSDTEKENVDVNVEEKVERKQRKVVDNGQFDNNQFKMLHLDEFSSGSEEYIQNSKAKMNKIDQGKSNKTSQLNKVKLLKTETNAKSLEALSKQTNQQLDKRSPIHNLVQKSFEENEKKQKKNKKHDNRKLIENNNIRNKIEKTVANAENMAKSLHHSMQKLHLNADTTIELAKENNESTTSMTNLNISIMEQLNRGVQVEDLTLPPGITLTKVDPTRAEALRAKTESIGKLSQPMQSHQQTNPMPPSIISPALLPHLGRFGADQSGVIMVDAMGPRRSSDSLIKDNKKSKRSKRRGKKKKIEGNGADDSLKQKSGESKMITLRNPMFHGPAVHNPVLSMPNRVPIAPLPMDQPAAIIKNENGMFTIRNPALHQAFSNGMQNTYRQCNVNFFTPTPNFSYFSDNMSSSSQYSNSTNGGKCLSAIGSEVKNAQQQKRSQWDSNQGGCSPQNGCGYVEDRNCSSMQQKYQQSNYYNDFEVFPSNSSSCGNLFDNNSHNCDDSPPPSVTGFNHYLDGISNSSSSSKYDDMTFLRNLIPGQRLNSEVTIHNINDSKFSGNSTSPVHHRVEITPISRPTSRLNNFSPDSNQSLQNRNYNPTLGEYGDSLFAPNQMLNLNDLESDERDIESFKRFSYGFEPPKEKPKANINMNDLLVNNKRTNSRSSPYLDESLENFVRNMNSLKISTEGSVNGSSQEGANGNWW